MRKQALLLLLTGSTGNLNKKQKRKFSGLTAPASDLSCLRHPGPSDLPSADCLSMVVGWDGVVVPLQQHKLSFLFTSLLKDSILIQPGNTAGEMDGKSYIIFKNV